MICSSLDFSLDLAWPAFTLTGIWSLSSCSSRIGPCLFTFGAGVSSLSLLELPAYWGMISTAYSSSILYLLIAICGPSTFCSRSNSSLLNSYRLFYSTLLPYPICLLFSFRCAGRSKALYARLGSTSKLPPCSDPPLAVFQVGLCAVVILQLYFN